MVHGMSQHINKHAEAYRKVFVNHVDQKSVTVNIEGVGAQDFSLAIERLLSEVSQQVKGDAVEIMTPSFSTTDPISKTVMSVMVLDSLKSYFSYGMQLLCGIPAVRLLGTEADWALLIIKAQQFSSILAQGENNVGDVAVNWLKELVPILENFLSTKQGNRNEKFWSTCVTQKQYGSGDDAYRDGWFTRFFLYDRKGDVIQGMGGLDEDDLSPSRVDVPFTLNENKMQLTAGHLGIAIDFVEGSVAPVMGWAVKTKLMKKNGNFHVLLTKTKHRLS